jgi:hypothetical protein
VSDRKAALARRFGARAVAVAVVALLTATSCTTKHSGGGRDASAPVAKPKDAWEAALDDVSADGTFTLPAALALFDVAYGDMPGATMPAAPAPKAILDGTSALLAVEAHRSELTPAQGARLDAVLNDTSSDGGAPILVAPAAFHPGRSAVAPPTTVDPALRTAIQGEIELYRAAIAAKLGFNLPGSIVVTFPAHDLGDDTIANAQAMSDPATGAYTGCHIRVYPIISTELGDYRRLVIPHELTHCYQFAVAGSSAALARLPAWLVEGFAMWAADDLTGAVDAWWPHWLTEPATPLFRRSYDALGFYGDLAKAGFDPWSNFKAMFAAGLSNPARVAAAHGDDDAVLDVWASRTAQRPSLGPAWLTQGPSVPPGDGAAPAPLTVTDAGTPVSAKPYAAALYALSTSGDILDVTVEGHARIADGHVDTPLDAHDQYCTRPHGCACPNGGDAVPPAPLAAAGALLALTGGPDGTTATVRSKSLDDTCKQAAPVPAPTGPAHLPTDDPCQLIDRTEAEKVVGAAMPAQTEMEDDSIVERNIQAINELSHSNFDLAGTVRICIHSGAPVDAGGNAPSGSPMLAVGIESLTRGDFPSIQGVLAHTGTDVSAQIGLPAVLNIKVGTITAANLTIVFDPTHAVVVFAQSQEVALAAGKRIVELSR